MDWSKVHRKLAGRFRLLERRNEDGDCVIHCFGSLGQTGVNNDDVRYICGFYTKIQKFGMLTITGIIGGIFFYLIGYGWIGLLGWVLGGILSDVVLKIGGYQKFKVTVLSYACFCLGIMGCPANLWFAGEAYWENIHTSMGDQYANTLQSLMPSWMLYVGFALLFVGGILGALLGHKMLKKHFERAGIV